MLEYRTILEHDVVKTGQDSFTVKEDGRNAGVVELADLVAKIGDQSSQKWQ